MSHETEIREQDLESEFGTFQAQILKRVNTPVF